MNDELLEHFIEENYRLSERLKVISLKSSGRKKQVKLLTNAMTNQRHRLADKIDLLERGNVEKARQVNLYAQDLLEAKENYDRDNLELINALNEASLKMEELQKQAEENETRIERTKMNAEYLRKENDRIKDELRNLRLEQSKTFLQRIKQWFKR